MSDPLRKPVSGEPFVPSARQFGTFIDAARKVDELARNQQDRRGDAYDPTRVWVSNETGGDLTTARPIVGLGDPVLDPSVSGGESKALERPVIQGIAPDADEPFAVLQAPLRDGVIAPAVVAGVTWVRLDATADDDGIDHAEPDTNARLKLSTAGTAFVIWREGGAGEQWALVLLGHIATHGFGKLNQPVTKGRLTAGETVSVWKGPALAVDADTGRDQAIHYATHDMVLDDYVSWSRVGGMVYVTPWECPE